MSSGFEQRLRCAGAHAHVCGLLSAAHGTSHQGPGWWQGRQGEQQLWLLASVGLFAAAAGATCMNSEPLLFTSSSGSSSWCCWHLDLCVGHHTEMQIGSPALCRAAHVSSQVTVLHAALAGAMATLIVLAQFLDRPRSHSMHECFTGIKLGELSLWTMMSALANVAHMSNCCHTLDPLQTVLTSRLRNSQVYCEQSLPPVGGHLHSFGQHASDSVRHVRQKWLAHKLHRHCLMMSGLLLISFGGWLILSAVWETEGCCSLGQRQTLHV